jgi:hypothetical protein
MREPKVSDLLFDNQLIDEHEKPALAVIDGTQVFVRAIVGVC